MTIAASPSISKPERTDDQLAAGRAGAADFADALLSSAGKAIASQAAQDSTGLGRSGGGSRRKDGQKETVRRAKAVTDPTAIAGSELATHAATKATTKAAEQASLTPDRPAARPAQAGSKPEPQDARPRAGSPRPAEQRSAEVPKAQPKPDHTPGTPQHAPSSQAKSVAASIPPIKTKIPDVRARAADAIQALAKLAPQSVRPASTSSTPNRSPLRLEIARGAQRAAATKQPTTAKPPAKPQESEDDFPAQLAKGFSAIMRQNGGSLTLRLQPEALGDMTIRMDMQPGRVAATFEVDSDQARKLLDGNMTALRSALEAKGLSVDSLTVHVSERPAPEAAAASPHPAEPGVNGGAGNPGGGATGRGSGDGGGADGDRPVFAAARSANLDAFTPGSGVDAGEDSGGAHTVRLVLDAIA